MTFAVVVLRYFSCVLKHDDRPLCPMQLCVLGPWDEAELSGQQGAANLPLSSVIDYL